MALQQKTAELRKLAADLQSGAISKSEAVEQISKDADANCIPAWELALSSVHDRGAAVVVEALGRMAAPEASLSLARHAIWAKDDTVRAAAESALKDRDQHSFIPAMLAELQGPWVAARSYAFDGYGRLVVRYALMADGADKQTLRMLDDIYFLSGNRQVAASRASSNSNNLIASSESERTEENASIKQNNDQIMSVLRSVTGEHSLETPQDWWQWWDDENEVYATREKPIFASYAYRTSEVSAPIVYAKPSLRVERVEKKDCLAAGTPILTQRGPIAIERVRIGDLVMAKNAETGEVRFCTVLSTTIRDPEPLIRVTLESNTGKSEQVLRASGGHPFWVSGKGWVRARELQSGMRLHGLERSSEVKEVSLEEKPTRTYNLLVDGFHSYFIGQAAIMSHDNSAIEPVGCTVPGLKQ
ncbi:MAG: polymorphic toxin-type HINT domain-containing protein [Pirellulales bacterium]